jgi:Phosphotransferase enzyme family
VILAVARSRPYEPALNLPGEQEAAPWLFLLPSLDLRRVVVIGRASRGTRVALSALGARVEEASPRSSAGSLQEAADLVYVSFESAPPLARDGRAVDALGQLVRNGSSVYISGGGRDSRAAGALMRMLDVSATVELGESPTDRGMPGGADGPAAWLIPGGGRRERPKAIRLTQRVSRRMRRVRPPAASESLLAVSRVAAGATPPRPGEGVLVHADGSAPRQLPRYVRSAARRAGRDLDNAVWALAPPRRYRSQKVVFHLGERGELLKITQDPRFNPALRAEYDALVALQEWGESHPGVAPRPLFAGEHAGLLVIGESRLEGEPFRRRSDGTVTCPVAQATIDALLELAGAEVREFPGAEVAAPLAELLERYVGLLGPPAAHARLIEEQIGLIEANGSTFRTAFSHGDPTTHNVLVDAKGGIGLIDWENAERFGMPLWDLLRFVSAYAAWSAQLAGRRWSVPLACATLFEPSPFHDLLARSIARYRSTTELGEELVPPLVLTWLMVESLRQATRLPIGASTTGYAARLLARIAAHGGHGGLLELARPRAH